MENQITTEDMVIVPGVREAASEDGAVAGKHVSDARDVTR